MNPTLYGYVWDTNCWIDVFGLEERMPKWMKPRRGYQRHHLIPYSVWENSSFLQQSGMNVNGATNMTFLPVADGIDLAHPNSSLHLGNNKVHIDFNVYVKQESERLAKLAERNNWDQNKIQEEVRKLQSELKHKLKEGELKCH